VIVVAQHSPDPKCGLEIPKVPQELLNGGRIAPLQREIAGHDDQVRPGLRQELEDLPFPAAIPAHVQVRQMGHDQPVKLAWEVREPGLATRDLGPVRLDNPDVDQENL